MKKPDSRCKGATIHPTCRKCVSVLAIYLVEIMEFLLINMIRAFALRLFRKGVATFATDRRNIEYVH